MIQSKSCHQAKNTIIMRPEKNKSNNKLLTFDVLLAYNEKKQVKKL